MAIATPEVYAEMIDRAKAGAGGSQAGRDRKGGERAGTNGTAGRGVSRPAVG